MFIRKNVVDRKGLNYIENFDGTVRVVPEGESVFASHDEFEDVSIRVHARLHR